MQSKKINMSKHILIYQNNNMDQSLKSQQKEHSNIITIDILKFKMVLGVIAAIVIISTILVLSLTTNDFFFNKILTTSLIIGSILLVKYIGESKTKKTIIKK